jgi:hypothetical protein
VSVKGLLNGIKNLMGMVILVQSVQGLMVGATKDKGIGELEDAN